MGSGRITSGVVGVGDGLGSGVGVGVGSGLCVWVGCGLGSAVTVEVSEGEGEGELVAVGLSVGSTTITGGVGSERRRVTSLDHPEYNGAVSWSDRILNV